MTTAIEPHLYQQVAQRIESLIAAGTLRVGQRVPSVRKLSQQLDTSISTILQAYRLLEDRGLIEARPQSGYYVRQPVRPPPPEPECSAPSCKPTPVTVGDLAMKVLRAMEDPGIIALGAALPGPHCLPTQRLNRIMASVARRTRRGSNVYDAPPGCRELRVQVARRALEAGCALSPDEIVTTCGSQEALSLCLRAVAGPGDTIAIESPTFYGILQAIESLGMKALEIPTHPRDGVSLDALGYALDENPRIKACLFVTNFNNPLGSMMPDENKRQLVELLGAREIPLIEDDIYGDTGFAATRPRTCKSYDTNGLVLLCSSFSKTLAPGHRVGWAAPGRWFSAVERLKVVSTLATATLPQLAIADFLAAGHYDHHLRRIRRLYAQQVQDMTSAIQHHFPAETRLTRPQGGSVLWVELPGQVNSLELHDRALEHRISIAPGPLFSPKPRYTNFIRVSCGYSVSGDIERAVQTLGGLIRTMI